MQVLPRNTKHLALPYHLCGFGPLNHCPRRCGPWSLHGTQPPLNVTVIGFDTVIAVATRSLTATPRYMTIGLEAHEWPLDNSAVRRARQRAAVGSRSSPMPCAGTAWRPHGRVFRTGRNRRSDHAVDSSEQVPPLAG